MARFTTHVQACYQPDSLQDRFDVDGKTRNINIQLFCSNVACFLLPVLPYLKKSLFFFFFRSSYYFCNGVFGNCLPALWPTQHVIILILYKIAGLLLEWRVLLSISTKNVLRRLRKITDDDESDGNENIKKEIGLY